MKKYDTNVKLVRVIEHLFDKATGAALLNGTSTSSIWVQLSPTRDPALKRLRAMW